MNLHNEMLTQASPGRINYNLYTPTPLDITYQLVITSKLFEDLDMMLGQIIPFFNTDIYVGWRHPKYKNVQYKSQVNMNSDIQFESFPDISKD